MVALDSKFRGERSNSLHIQKWWKILWHLNIPPKVRIFIWRLYHEAIPSLLNLSYRKIVVNPLCPCCNQNMEFSAHTLFCYPKVKPYCWGVFGIKRGSWGGKAVGLFCGFDSG
ncbi:hypothetical protein ACOSP7_008135 [Xanthoceras sorbifolium]